MDYIIRKIAKEPEWRDGASGHVSAALKFACDKKSGDQQRTKYEEAA